EDGEGHLRRVGIAGIGGNLDDRDLQERVDLIRGQPRAVVLAHGLDHVVDQPLHVRRPDGLDGDRLRSLAQHGMSEARHLQDRHDAHNCSMWSQHPGRGHVTPAYPKESTMSMTPEGLDPSIRTREIVFEADVSSVTPFLKLATVSRGGSGHMTFACDEGPSLG